LRLWSCVLRWHAVPQPSTGALGKYASAILNIETTYEIIRCHNLRVHIRNAGSGRRHIAENNVWNGQRTSAEILEKTS
jgi:hypothetical protein